MSTNIITYARKTTRKELGKVLKSGEISNDVQLRALNAIGVALLPNGKKQRLSFEAENNKIYGHKFIIDKCSTWQKILTKDLYHEFQSHFNRLIEHSKFNRFFYRTDRKYPKVIESELWHLVNQHYYSSEDLLDHLEEKYGCHVKWLTTTSENRKEEDNSFRTVYNKYMNDYYLINYIYVLRIDYCLETNEIDLIDLVVM